MIKKIITGVVAAASIAICAAAFAQMPGAVISIPGTTGIIKDKIDSLMAPPKVDGYTVTFKLLEDDPEPWITVLVEPGHSALDLLQLSNRVPEREYHMFDAWSAPITNVTSDMTVWATWTRMKGTVTFESDDKGSVSAKVITMKTFENKYTSEVLDIPSPYTVDLGDTVVFTATPNSDTIAFSGWQKDNVALTEGNILQFVADASTVSVTANFRDVTKYTVSFLFVDGESSHTFDSVSVFNGFKINRDLIPDEAEINNYLSPLGYILKDDTWYKDPDRENKFDFDEDVVTNRLSLYVNWVMSEEREEFTEGDGTEGNPYIINTAEQLAYLAYVVNLGAPGFADAHYRLDSDVSLARYNSDSKFNYGKGWVPIGSIYEDEDGVEYRRTFNGIFDGNGKTVSNLYINDNTLEYGGLFGTVVGGTVKDLGVIEVDINVKGIAGAIAGQVEGGGVIDVCYATGTIRGTGDDIGGLVGHVGRGMGGSGSVINSNFSGDVQGGNNVGGIVGFLIGPSYNISSIRNCYTSESTNIEGRSTVGGIVGRVEYDCVVSNSLSNGTVTGSVGSVGGIVGVLLGGNNETIVSDCFSTVNVSGANFVGGVAGSLFTNGTESQSATITRSYSIGTVTGDNNVGGVAGRAVNTTTIEDCAALNPDVITRVGNNIGRVAGRLTCDEADRDIDYFLFDCNVVGTLSNNVAFDGTKVNGTAVSSDDAASINGADITATAIKADGEIGGRFVAANGWTTENGKLPGLFGSAVEMPLYMDSDVCETDPGYGCPGFCEDPANAYDPGCIADRCADDLTRDCPTYCVVNDTDPDCIAERCAANPTYGCDGFCDDAANADDPGCIADWCLANPTDPACGTGGGHWYSDNTGDTYYISSAAELLELAEIVNGDHSDIVQNNFQGKTIELTDDIDLSVYGSSYNDGKGWTPIGSGLSAFRGTFNGNGNIVSGLYIGNPFLNQAGLFGLVNNGRIENLGVTDTYIDAGSSVGGVVGILGESSNVDNCYSTGTVIGKGSVGGVVGYVSGESVVANCYSTVSVSGSDEYVGGVVGQSDESSISNCYSVGNVSGYDYVGGVVGSIWGDSEITNCAALNASVNASYGDGADIGRVAGELFSATYSNVIAYDGMQLNVVADGDRNIHGTDISAADIRADGTIGGLFTDANVWTTADGKLPGLFGNTVDMPCHLSEGGCNSGGDPAPNNNVGLQAEASVVAPAIPRVVNEFSAGPNPVLSTAGSVNIYRAGAAVTNRTTLIVYSAQGKMIKRIVINDKGGDGIRVVGTWDLKDSRDRAVPPGTYLARGSVKVAGKREKVSILIGVK